MNEFSSKNNDNINKNNEEKKQNENNISETKNEDIENNDNKDKTLIDALSSSPLLPVLPHELPFGDY
jgi:hypothetical protein